MWRRWWSQSETIASPPGAIRGTISTITYAKLRSVGNRTTGGFAVAKHLDNVIRTQVRPAQLSVDDLVQQQAKTLLCRHGTRRRPTTSTASRTSPTLCDSQRVSLLKTWCCISVVQFPQTVICPRTRFPVGALKPFRLGTEPGRTLRSQDCALP
jgi:hypothetical protein